MSTPTRFGRAPIYRLSRALGYDPTATVGDPEPPVDRMLAAAIETPQEHISYGAAVDVNLAATVTDGGGSRTFSDPGNANDGDNGTRAIRGAYANGASTSILRSAFAGPCRVSAMVLDLISASAISGWTAECSDNGTDWTSVGAGTNVGGSTGSMEWSFPAVVTSFMRVIQSEGGTGYHPAIDIGTWSITGEPQTSVATHWHPAPLVQDGDDATYQYVEVDVDGAIARAMLEAPYRLARSVLRVGLASAGEATFTIVGGNLADFSDEETLASVTIEATGSYTADEVEFVLPNTNGFQFYRIDGPADARIYTWEAYEGSDNLADYQLRSEKGNANGYAPLDGSGLVPYASLGTGGDGSGDNVLRDDGTWKPVAPGSGSGDTSGQLSAGFDGGGSVITVGKIYYGVAPYSGTITGWRILGTPSGSVAFDVAVCAAGSLPAFPDDSIAASAHPSMSGDTEASGSTLTGWITAISAGDNYAIKVDSATTVTWASLTLFYSRP